MLCMYELRLAAGQRPVCIKYSRQSRLYIPGRVWTSEGACASLRWCFHRHVRQDYPWSCQIASMYFVSSIHRQVHQGSIWFCQPTRIPLLAGAALEPLFRPAGQHMSCQHTAGIPEYLPTEVVLSSTGRLYAFCFWYGQCAYLQVCCPSPVLRIVLAGSAYKGSNAYP